jgi:hypothetical protein
MIPKGLEFANFGGATGVPFTLKNQYFGDINDYRKYGLLRLLAGVGGLRIGVAWMLTPDDGCSDGGKTGYVKHPEQWRESDPALFRFLAKAVGE